MLSKPSSDSQIDSSERNQNKLFDQDINKELEAFLNKKSKSSYQFASQIKSIMEELDEENGANFNSDSFFN